MSPHALRNGLALSAILWLGIYLTARTLWTAL